MTVGEIVTKLEEHAAWLVREDRGTGYGQDMRARMTAKTLALLAQLRAELAGLASSATEAQLRDAVSLPQQQLPTNFDPDSLLRG